MSEMHEALRSLPSVERLAWELPGPRHLAVIAARAGIATARGAILAGALAEVDSDALHDDAVALVAQLAAASVRPLINASGVVLHTNLGRAPIAPEAAAAAAAIASGYSNLELDLDSGGRGSRHDHLQAPLRALTGAEAVLAVNNNAAAVMLTLAALAGSGQVVVGRDQLVEIGGSFRIPEILAQSGATLTEVGTTNRTTAADYEGAVGPQTAALMRVHQSNFRTVGFTTTPALCELVDVAGRHGLPLIDDLGSGAISAIGDEPVVQESVSAGADAVCFSADKLLGGPQAGIIAGTADAVERCRRHPLARALRLDKLQLAALEATLRLHRDAGPAAIPALRMLAADEQELAGRVERMCGLIGPSARAASSEAVAGGGALPMHELPGPVCAVHPGELGADALAARLRVGDPPVVARIGREELLLDPRTMDDDEADAAAAAVVTALG